MPFLQQQPGLFARANIEALNSNQIGVYGLFRQGVWVYVGKGDIRQRLLDHLNGDNPCITRENPTHWVAEVTSGDPSIRERELITELQPVCNKRVG
ncbi:MAG: GIY-YIG nuclease family protein [candidate division Zixibacteria bacterium]|nr:GIY-YIG nuclease family protein [candidate division Zixibacteria bacterium]